MFSIPDHVRGPYHPHETWRRQCLERMERDLSIFVVIRYISSLDIQISIFLKTRTVYLSMLEYPHSLQNVFMFKATEDLRMGPYTVKPG